MLCELATILPGIVGTLLDCESKIKRGHYREETFTNILTGALTAFAGPSLIIEYPDELSTGSDLDLNFMSVADGRCLCLRIQAKRLNGHADGRPGINNRSYSELLHTPNTSPLYQYITLTQRPRNFLPLYMFYNHWTVTTSPFFVGMHPVVSGINLAFADDVAWEMDKMLAASQATPPKRLHYKRLSHLRPYFFDLTSILCCPIEVGETVPSPHAVRRRLLGVWNNIAHLGPMTIGDKIKHSPLVPEVLNGTDCPSRVIDDGPAVRMNSEVERPTINFVTGRSVDNPGPSIWSQQQPG